MGERRLHLPDHEAQEDLDAGPGPEPGMDAGMDAGADADLDAGADADLGADLDSGRDVPGGMPEPPGVPMPAGPGPDRNPGPDLGPELSPEPSPEPSFTPGPSLPLMPRDPAQDLIDTELAEHERWGALGATGSQERAEYAAAAAGAGITQGALGGFAAGAEVGLIGGQVSIVSGLAAKALVSDRTIMLAGTSVSLGSKVLPLIGPILGGAMSAKSLFMDGGWRRDWETLDGPSTGASGYEQAAIDIQRICAVLDLESNLAGVLAGVAGVLAAAGLAAGVLSFGALLPMAALAGEVALVLGTTGTVLSVVQMALTPLVTLFRALHTYTLDSDPAGVERAGAKLGEAGADLGGMVGSMAGGKTGGLAATVSIPDLPDAAPRVPPEPDHVTSAAPAGPLVVEAHLPGAAPGTDAAGPHTGTGRVFTDAEVEVLLGGLEAPQHETFTQVEVSSHDPNVDALVELTGGAPAPGARPGPAPETDVDWKNPAVLRALGLDPVTGRPKRDPVTGAVLPNPHKGPGELAWDRSEVGYDVDRPDGPGPFNGHQGMVKNGEWAPEGVFELTPGEGLSAQPGPDGQRARVGYGVRVGPPGSFVDHVFATRAEAQAYVAELARRGSGRIRSESALPLEWPAGPNGERYPGNPVDEARILEVPAGTPMIRSTVAVQPESAPGDHPLLIGGGPQTQLPQHVFPRPPQGSAPGTPSPAQVGAPVPIVQTVVPDYTPPPTAGEQLRAAFDTADQLTALAAQQQAAAGRAAAVEAAAAAQAQAAAGQEREVLGVVDVASAASTLAAQRKEEAAKSRSGTASAGTQLGTAGQKLAGTGTLVTLLGGLAGFTGVILEFSSILPDAAVRGVQTVNRDSTRFLGQLTGIRGLIEDQGEGLPARAAVAEQNEQRLGAAGQDLAGTQDSLRSSASGLADITARQQAAADSARQEQQEALGRAATATDAAARLTAQREAEQARLAAWAQEHQAKRRAAIDAKVAQLEALGLVVDRRPE